MKKLLSGIAGLLVLGVVFAGGMYANSWLSYNSASVETANSDVDRIMELFREVNDEKISIEEAYAELEALNPKGLVNKIKQLEADLAASNQSNSELTANLEQANQAKAEAENSLAGKQQELDNKHQELLNKQAEVEAKQQEINEKNQAYDQLQQQRDAIAAERDDYKAQLDNHSNYVKHLESELEKANQSTASHAQKTTEALEEAESYK